MTDPTIQMLRNPGPIHHLLGNTIWERSVSWGMPWQFDTAAHWVAEAQAFRERHAGEQHTHRLTTRLDHEVALCILGGWGMPYETGLAAFASLQRAGLLHPDADVDAIRDVLQRPLSVAGGTRRYRFPVQRASRLRAALHYLHSAPAQPDPDHRSFRDWLAQCPGIGLKTASWVTRNWLDSDAVAILDIHVLRAGQTAGVFDPTWTALRHYRIIEQAFIDWAHIGGVRVADLDAVIWRARARQARTTHRSRSHQ